MLTLNQSLEQQLRAEAKTRGIDTQDLFIEVIERFLKEIQDERCANELRRGLKASGGHHEG